MNKIECLLIRACKSDQGILRVEKLFNRFYCPHSPTKFHWESIAAILSNLTDKYCPMDTKAWIVHMNPDNYQYSGVSESDSHHEKVCRIMANHIKNHYMPMQGGGFIIPAAFRN